VSPIRNAEDSSIKKIIAVFAAAVIALCPLVQPAEAVCAASTAPGTYAAAAGTASDTAGTDALKSGEADYICSLAVKSGPLAGAIPESTADNTVNPYFDDFACLGLVSYGRAADRQTVLSYINWHIAHMNTAAQDKYGLAGTIYDYADGVSTGNYDSTDSYAATFIMLLDNYCRVYDSDFLRGREDLLDTLVSVMKSTYIEKISLSKATPGYDECILMDNCEVFRGFKSASHIYSSYLNDTAKAAAMQTYAARTKTAIRKRFWSSSQHCFRPAADISGRPESRTRLSIFYPDASCQLFPVIYGVIKPEGSMAKHAYAAFKKYYLRKGVSGRDWAAVSVRGSEGYPWCILLSGIIKMNDMKTAHRYEKNLQKKFITSGHPYPYYCGEAGWYLMSLSAR
jgi:hypothetical protein